MKKLFILISVFSILISLSFAFQSKHMDLCCGEQQHSSIQCTTCTHPPKTHSEFALFIPALLGQIFFDFIHSEELKVIIPVERPPTLLS